MTIEWSWKNWLVEQVDDDQKAAGVFCEDGFGLISSMSEECSREGNALEMLSSIAMQSATEDDSQTETPSPFHNMAYTPPAIQLTHARNYLG